MKKKKVLYFVPENPLVGKAGNLTRFKKLLYYFIDNKADFDIDLLSVRYWDDNGNWQPADLELFKQQLPEVNLHIFNRKPPKTRFFQYLFNYKLPLLWHTLFVKKKTLDVTTFYFREQMHKLLQTQKYDVIILSYANWANLLNRTPDSPYLILDTHDFLTLQQKFNTPDLGDVIFTSLQEEINELKKFDEVWSYSTEEQYIFDQFTENLNVKFFPASIPVAKCRRTETNKYDLLYVASDNGHNIKGINWYIEQVLPFLPDDVTTYMAGAICTKIGDHPRIVKLGVVEDIDTIYQETKIVICPMLTGTGIKIKVLEALSYGIPVVTNRRGVDGLLNKVQNGCLVMDKAEDFAQGILALLNDANLYNKLAEQGKTYFELNHSPEKEKEFLDSVFYKVS